MPLFMQEDGEDNERDYYRVLEYEYNLAENETGETILHKRERH